MFPSMTIIGPNLSQQKHAHTIKLPPPCFTVGAMQSRLKRSTDVLLIRRSRDPYQSSILHSSDHMTRFQSFSDHPRQPRHHIKRFIELTFEMNGFFTADFDRIPDASNFL